MYVFVLRVRLAFVARRVAPRKVVVVSVATGSRLELYNQRHVPIGVYRASRCQIERDEHDMNFWFRCGGHADNLQSAGCRMIGLKSKLLDIKG